MLYIVWKSRDFTIVTRRRVTDTLVRHFFPLEKYKKNID